MQPTTREQPSGRCAELEASVAALVDGELPAATATKLLHHAGECPRCEALLAAERRLVGLARELSTPGPAAELASRIATAVDGLALAERRAALGSGSGGGGVWRQWLSLAAVITVAVLVGALLGARHQAELQAIEQARQQAPAPVSSATTPPANRVRELPAKAVASSRPGSRSRVREVSEPIHEALTRHAISTEAVYQQALGLRKERTELARKVLELELRLADLGPRTRALRARAAKEPMFAETAEGYLRSASAVVARIDGWVRDKDRPLAELQVALEGDPLPEQIRHLEAEIRKVEPRLQLGSLAAEVGIDIDVSDDPDLPADLVLGRMLLHRGGDLRQALALLDRVRRASPQHSAMAGADHVKALAERHRRIVIQMRGVGGAGMMIVEAHGGEGEPMAFAIPAAALEVNGQRQALAPPRQRPVTLAFIALRRVVEGDPSERGALLVRETLLRAPTGSLRRVGLRFEEAGWRPQTRQALGALYDAAAWKATRVETPEAVRLTVADALFREALEQTR